MIDEETGLDKRILAAGEVFRDRLIAEAEAEGKIIVDEAGGMVSSTEVHYRAWARRTGELLIDYTGPGYDHFAAAKAAVETRTGPWASSAALAVAAAEQALEAVYGADDAAA